MFELVGKRMVRVHLKSGPSLEGLLLARGRFFRLAGVTVHEAPESSYSADGEIVIPRDNVAFFQVLR